MFWFWFWFFFFFQKKFKFFLLVSLPFDRKHSVRVDGCLRKHGHQFWKLAKVSNKSLKLFGSNLESDLLIITQNPHFIVVSCNSLHIFEIKPFFEKNFDFNISIFIFLNLFFPNFPRYLILSDNAFFGFLIC